MVIHELTTLRELTNLSFALQPIRRAIGKNELKLSQSIEDIVFWQIKYKQPLSYL
jgi:hypothetical protein